MKTCNSLCAVLLINATLLAGCGKQEPEAEKFVRSRLPGELRNVAYSADKKTVCGEIGSATGRFVRFFSRWQERTFAYEGTADFTLRAYSDACELGMTTAQIAAEEVRLQEAEQARIAERERAERQAARDLWLQQNAEAIQSLHEAARQLQGR